MPGPDNIFVLTESLAKGVKNGVLISLGLNLGVLVHTLAATTGVSLILKQSELAFTVVQYAGAIYLLYLAYKAFREKTSPILGEQSTVDGNFKLIRTGFIMNVLNPKVSLFFIAFLPNFVAADLGSVTKQMIVLGISFMLIGFISFSGFAMLASQLRKALSSLKVLEGIKWAKILVLIVLSVFLLLP